MRNHLTVPSFFAVNPAIAVPSRRASTSPRCEKPDEARFSDGSGRVELANRIASSDNPLTARVMVNRVWGKLIGRPLVDTPSDFGIRTAPPVVEGLLDELAADFAEHWSVKKIIRRIVTSRIYRQSSVADESAVQRDPDNQWLARGNRKRRDFESLRDSLLMVSDSLDRSLGGEPVEITLPTPANRRTIYAKIDRQNLPSLFRTFDFASPDAHAPKRYFTTVPQQALYLLNAEQTATLARRAAEQIRRMTDSLSSEHLVHLLFRQVLGRQPSGEETELCVAFLKQPARPTTAGYRSAEAWKYGTSSTDEQLRPTMFEPFKVFKESRLQSADKFPADGPAGHAFLGNENGHPRKSSRRCPSLDGAGGRIRPRQRPDGASQPKWRRNPRRHLGRQRKHLFRNTEK